MEKFEWDGSHLGDYPSSIILSSTKTRIGRYCQVQIGNIKGMGILRASVDYTPCLVDEHKPIFNINKIGTHSLKIDGRLYILTRPMTASIDTFNPEDDMIIDDIPMSELHINPSAADLVFRHQVQELLCFRDIMALAGSHVGSIFIRVPETRRPYPISVKEYSMRFGDRKSTLSNTVAQKWFSDRSISDVLVCMLRIDLEHFDMSMLLAKYRSEMENVFTRIDKRRVCSVVLILNRIMNRILSQI